MSEEIRVPEIWIERGVTTEQQVVDEINTALGNMKHLDFGYYIGSSSCGSILITINQDGKLIDAFPAKFDKATYDRIKQEVDESGLGAPDEMHLQIVTLAIAVDFMNYYDIFLKKQPISGRYSIFDSSVFDTAMGELIMVSIEGLGKLVIGYTATKEVLEQFV